LRRRTEGAEAAAGAQGSWMDGKEWEQWVESRPAGRRVGGERRLGQGVSK